MASDLSEEEQIEAFKRWWNENWVTIILPLIVGVLLYVGWHWWQDYKAEEAQIASDKYEELSRVLESAAESELSAEQKAKAIAKAEGIVTDHSKTLYADFAKLTLGKLSLDDGDLDKAASIISGVAQNGANESIQLLAKLRLAKIYTAQKRFSEALALVEQTSDDAYASLYAEQRGDIYFAQGETAAANTAYALALEKLDPQGYSRSGLIQAKLSATAVPKVEEALVENQETDSISEETKMEAENSTTATESDVEAGDAEADDAEASEALAAGESE